MPYQANSPRHLAQTRLTNPRHCQGESQGAMRSLITDNLRI